MFEEINNWLLTRCGKFTSSEIHKLIPNGRAKGEIFSTTGKTYIKQKAAELITKEPIQKPTTYAMEWGLSHENEALMIFEEMYGEIEKFGGGNPQFFMYNQKWGGTPDATFADAVIEVKCPFNSSEHFEHLLMNTADDLKDYAPEYYWQMVSNMIILKKNYGIFVSYDPRFPLEHNLKVLKFELNPLDAEFLISKVEKAIVELNRLTSLIYATEATEENPSSIQ